MADRIGQQLGNYRLIGMLGEGGFAEVYLGEHIHLGTRAAIKVLHTQLTNDDVEKFRTEARTIAHLVHPNIVRVLEFGVEGKTPFLVMDFAPKGTVRQRHPKGTPLPLVTIEYYVKQVAEALQYAHDAKLIHRDVKPENMLLGGRNEVLLSDFGIALVAQSSRFQSTQEMAGTMAYIAPEQIQGKPRPASDQYSLGIVVYEWLSGDRPFHGSFTELVGQHLSVPPPSLRAKVPTVLPDVEQVVMTALAKDPKERFISVQAFATALQQASQSDKPTIVKPPMPVAQQPRMKTPPIQMQKSTVGITPPNQRQTRDVAVTPPNLPPQQHGSMQMSPLGGFAQPPMIENVGVQVIQRNWWMLALRGLLAIIFGLIALFFPGIAPLAFIFVFAAYAIIDGIVAVIVAVRERGSLSRWGWVLFEGILSILAGILAIAYPGITALVLLFIVAAWAILTGILEIVAAFVLREYVSREWLLAIAGILSIVFGIILFAHPGAGLLPILWLVGIYSIIFGILFIIRAFQLRSWASSVTR